MDKTKHITLPISSHRGFALIVTLSVLSVVIALTVVLLSYFTKVKEDAETTKALIQADVYYADVLEQLVRFKGKEKSFFNYLYRHPVSLHSPDRRFSLLLRCRPLSGGINVNWLALDHNNKKRYLFQEAQILFDTLAQQYNLEDPDRLLEMILNEIGTGKKYVKREQSRLIQKNGIISYQQFADIIKRYEIEVDDMNVARVPWQKYFTFLRKSDKIDIEYSSAELISFLFDIDIRSVREWKSQLRRPSLTVFVNNNGGNYNEKKMLFAGSKFLPQSRCSVNYDSGYKFTFDYIEGEAKYFEFFEKS